MFRLARPVNVVLLVAAAATLGAAGVIAAPWLEATGRPAGAWLRLLYSPACHQQAERCFEMAALPWAVCARCSGLYVGAVLGLWGGLLLADRRPRPRFWWLALAAGPTAVDAVLPWVGLPQLANLPRALLALPAGFVAGAVVALAVAEMIRDHQLEKRLLEVSDG